MNACIWLSIELSVEQTLQPNTTVSTVIFAVHQLFSDVNRFNLGVSFSHYVPFIGNSFSCDDKSFQPRFHGSTFEFARCKWFGHSNMEGKKLIKNFIQLKHFEKLFYKLFYLHGIMSAVCIVEHKRAHTHIHNSDHFALAWKMVSSAHQYTFCCWAFLRCKQTKK